MEGEEGGTDANTQNTYMKIKVNRCNKGTNYHQKQNYSSAS